MPKEVVTLQIGLKGQDEALSKLNSLDKLVQELNGKKIVLNVDTSSVQAFSKEVQKSIQLANQNISAQARLLKQKNQETSINLKNQQELTKQAELQAKVALEAEKTKQAIEKTSQEQAKAQAQAQKTAQEQAKVAQQAEKTVQQIEKTAQAEAKVAAEAQKTATVEEKRKLVADQLAAAYEKAELKATGLSSTTASIDSTPLQQQIDAITGVSREFYSAAESAKYFMEIEKKLGAETGEKLDLSKNLSTEGFNDYIKSVENLDNATVAATKSVQIGGSQFQQFAVSVKTASGDFQNFTYSVDTGTGAVYKLEKGMSTTNKAAGQLSQSLGEMIGKFAQWAIVSALFYAPIRAFQDAVDELKAVDSELVNIQKVMGATASEMDELSSKAFEVGSALGVAASDYLASVNKWAQAGYDSLSADLGELSVKTQKVGDVQEETANQFLLSVDAAYKYKGNIEELTKVLDGANEISNNYATSVEKLAGGMGIVSSLAAQAGMKVEETMAAIGTITAVTQESGNSAARALRALILNIQGSTEIAIDEETGERWTEDEIQQMAVALGDLNIATREYKNGVEQLRNPMEVIGELSQKYRDGLVSEVQLQEVVSALGGKVRSNQLQALISNYDTYEEMIETFEESVGSADRELDIYLNSWEAKANRLQNQWVQLADTMKASEISKGLLDLGNAVLTFVNTDFSPIEKWGEVLSDFSDGNTTTGILATSDAILESAGALSKLVIQIVAVTAAIVALRTAISGMGATDTGEAFLSGSKDFLGKVISEMAKIPAAASAAKAGMSGFSGALAGAKAGASAFGSAAVAAFGPVTLAIAAITAEVVIFKTVVDNFVSNERFSKKLEDTYSQLEDVNSEIESLNTELKTTQDRIDELNGKDSLTLVEQSELQQLEMANSLLESQLQIEQEIQKIRASNALDAAKDAVGNGGFTGNQDEITGGNWKNVIAGALTIANPLSLLGILGGRYLFDKTYKRDWESQLNALDAEMEKAVKENNEKRIQDLTELQADMMEQLQQELSSLDAESMMAADPEGFKEVLSSYQGLQFKLQAITNPIEAVANRLDQFKNSLDTESLEKYNQALADLASDGKVTAQEVEKLALLFPEIKSLVDTGFVTWEDLAEHFTSVANSANEAADGLGNFSDEQQENEEDSKSLAESLSELQGKVSELSSAQETLANNGKLGLEQVVSLMEAYPELEDTLVNYLAKVIDEAELRDILDQKYQEETNDYKLLIVQKMQASSEFYKSVILGNSEVVKKLNELGLTDLENYQTVEELKAAVAEKSQDAITSAAGDGAKGRAALYAEEASAFIKMQNQMLAAIPGAGMFKGQELLDKYGGGYTIPGVGKQESNSSRANSVLSDLNSAIDDILASALGDISFDTSDISGGGGTSGTGRGSTKSWYEEQIELLQDYVKQVQDTNTLLEKEDANSAEQRIKNLKEAQDRIHKTADDFRNAGLTDTSDEVKQLKLMWHDLADEIESVYQGMYDDLMEGLADDEWQLDLFQKNRERADRSVEEIAADNAKIVAEYKDMQNQVHDLANYYRSMGYDETDDLIQDLSDAWWDYQEKIESVYDSLTEAFEDYISESDRQLKALERTTGTAGQQIELYTQRIQEAQKAIAELQKANVNGINDDRIASIEDQIAQDEEDRESKRDELWDELVNAVDREFDKKQDEIDDAQKEVDRINEILDKYDKQLAEEIEPFEKTIEQAEKDLEDALEPIEDGLKELNDRLDDEKKALEALTDPLNKQIEGYYEVNPDGTVGVYVPGLNDQIEDLQDQLDAENEKWNEQQEREEEALQLQKKELALQEAIKNLEQAQLDLETARNERTVYTLKDGVWAWRADESAIKEAEDALEDAEQAKEDAENALQDFKEEQAHKEIVKLLENQIKALEKQKDQIEAQIEIYEKESEARQEYLQDLIDQAEAEKEAKEDYYNKIIEQNQKEIDARQEYYDNLKAQYDDELEFWETRVDELQKQYDEWAEQWEDIQDAMTGDVRSIEEILADIANYGTPQMKAQIDKVTDLLEQMGVAIGDFNQSMGDVSNLGTGGTTSNEQSIIDQMKANAQTWYEAYNRNDTAEMDRLEQLNTQLGNSIGAYRDYDGVWWDRYGNKLFGSWTPGDGYSASGTTASGTQSNYGGEQSTTGSGSSSGMTMGQVNDRIEEIRNQAVGASASEKKSLFDEANRLAVSKGAQSISYSPDINDWMWYNSSGDWLFDRGGVARGKGVMLKGVDEPEVVLNPVLAADVLNPARNDEFMQFADALGIMFSSAHDFAANLRATPPAVSNNSTDSHNVYINGVQIGESMMQKPLSETLSLLGIHRNM